MLQIPQVPSHHAAQQTAYLLNNSEYFFPPLNAICEVSNLVLGVTSYLYRKESRAASEKLPFFGAAFGLGLATTAYALGIMVPMNRRMVQMAENLERNAEDEKSAKELRRLQQRWQKLNYGASVGAIWSRLW